MPMHPNIVARTRSRKAAEAALRLLGKGYGFISHSRKVGSGEWDIPIDEWAIGRIEEFSPYGQDLLKLNAPDTDGQYYRVPQVVSKPGDYE